MVGPPGGGFYGLAARQGERRAVDLVPACTSSRADVVETGVRAREAVGDVAVAPVVSERTVGLDRAASWRRSDGEPVRLGCAEDPSVTLGADVELLSPTARVCDFVEELTEDGLGREYTVPVDVVLAPRAPLERDDRSGRT